MRLRDPVLIEKRAVDATLTPWQCLKRLSRWTLNTREWVVMSQRKGRGAEYVPRSDKLKMLPCGRQGPRALSRVLVGLFPAMFFEIREHLIVLGDMPLRTPRMQVVLLHQPHF